jgi:hypothetical protein
MFLKYHNMIIIQNKHRTNHNYREIQSSFINTFFFQAQVHLLGNLAVWYSGTLSVFAYVVLLAVYLLRRRRLCFDLPEGKCVDASLLLCVKNDLDSKIQKTPINLNYFKSAKGKIFSDGSFFAFNTILYDFFVNESLEYNE